MYYSVKRDMVSVMKLRSMSAVIFNKGEYYVYIEHFEAWLDRIVWQY